jgi:hypothetical protein
MAPQPGRPREPEGKRVTVCAKFSESEAAVIDTARGAMTRSEWLRRAVLAQAARGRPPAGYAGRAAGAVRENHAAAKGDCPHPKARINKGLCGACGTYVGTKETR